MPEQDTKWSYKTIILPTTQKKTKQIKAIRLVSSTVWMNDFKQYFLTRLSNVLMNIWQNSKDIPVSCPNMIKFNNNDMHGVDIMDQKTATSRLDCKCKYHVYFSMFFDLMDVSCVNSYAVYMKLGDDISLLNFKIVVAQPLVSRYSNRLFSTTRPSRRKSHEPSMTREIPNRMPEFQ